MFDIVPKRPQPGKVPRHSVVDIVAPHDCPQPFSGTPNGLVHALAQFRLDAFQLRCHAFADGLPHHRESPRLVYASANVRETQKVKGFRLPCSIPPSTFNGKSPELYQARLLRM
jgi:hypothetical protein